MTVKLTAKDLSGKYAYIWTRDNGDGKSTGIQDRIRVDKDEGYEVIYFIEALMNKHDLTASAYVHRIEELLHAPSLSTVVMRTELNSIIENAMGL
tara:strand:+ start:9413 stop:9697 length:285 start_codon:yes stop_codon:yes gene_type:complete